MAIYCTAKCLHQKQGTCTTIPVFEPLVEIKGLGKLPQCVSIQRVADEEGDMDATK